jgi:uncharacterized protein
MENNPHPALYKRKSFIIAAISVIIFVPILLMLLPLLRAPESRVPDSGPEPAVPQGIRIDADLSFTNTEGTGMERVLVEIAANAESRRQGLMGRVKMAENEGMLFLFDEEEERSFWMANTPLPLDIIYISSEKEVVSIQKHATPYSEESLPSYKPARFVVEMNAGFCDRHGIAPGTRVSWSERGTFRNSRPNEETGPTRH